LGSEKVICSCGSTYRREHGILCFTDHDSFYEGKFGAEKPVRRRGFARLIEKCYLKVSIYGTRTKHDRLYRNLRSGNRRNVKVLDIGCGGGNPDLRIDDSYHVTGIDLSLSSLINARDMYDEVYMASATSTPFPDDLFDCVCSFDLFGHLPPSEKDQVLREMGRVLKPQGLSFHYIEVDASKGYNKWAKKRPSLYRRYFIEQDGHIGLEDYRTVLNRFSEHGFSLLSFRCLAKIALLPGEISKRFDNFYKETSGPARVSVSFDKFVMGSSVLKSIWGIAMNLVANLIEPMMSNDYCGLLFVAHAMNQAS
jgi:ubiquinone/menaquinone biosynthesis C-methylase UbiE